MITDRSIILYQDAFYHQFEKIEEKGKLGLYFLDIKEKEKRSFWEVF